MRRCRSGTPGAQTVFLSSGSARLTVPTTVTIPDGQTSTTFQVTINGDATINPTDTATLTAFAPDALVGVGIDRLDYTKGIEERLSAVDTLLARHEEFRGKFTFVQLAAPSRTKIQSYGDLDGRVTALAAAITSSSSRSSRALMKAATFFRAFSYSAVATSER